MKIILIGNYPLDKQESMLRFAIMLSNGFKEKDVQSEIWQPVVVVGSFFSSFNPTVVKWIGYIDKWILFPIILKWRLWKNKKLYKEVRFHVCDHSNAPYLKYLPKNRTAITCHDVLAIRGALGHADAYCPPSKFGKILQKWILKNLLKAKLLASVSHFTINQLKNLSNTSSTKDRNWQVIHNAFNAQFFPMKKEQYEPLLRKMGLDVEVPFLLHIGGGHIRKNRTLLLPMAALMQKEWEGNIVYAGKPLDSATLKLADDLKLTSRVISIVGPNHEELVALYSACEAFVFPSFAEGFGWPVIEAQACGTVVIASNHDPMPEVSGNAALHADPKKPIEFADAFVSLKNNFDKRNTIIDSGFKNIHRFEVSKMIESYLLLHGYQAIKHS